MNNQMNKHNNQKLNNNTMKKLMITMLMLLSVLQMVAQNVNKDSHEYLPLIEENKQWNVCYNVADYYEYTRAYKWFGEDTVINDLTYKIIYASEKNSPYQWQIDCFMREDPATHKVYHRYTNSQYELLAYDFNLNEGETIFSDLEPSYYLVVQSVNDTTLEDGITRKKIELAWDGYIEETWIEGIGSTTGVTHGMKWFLDGYKSFLTCMTVNNEILYRDNASENCWIERPLGIDDIDKDDFLIYPNPAREYTYIDFGGSLSGEMEIYGITGMLVTKREYNGEALRLDLTGLQPGVYFVRLGNATMKFVKM